MTHEFGQHYIFELDFFEYRLLRELVVCTLAYQTLQVQKMVELEILTWSLSESLIVSDIQWPDFKNLESRSTQEKNRLIEFDITPPDS